MDKKEQIANSFMDTVEKNKDGDFLNELLEFTKISFKGTIDEDTITYILSTFKVIRPLIIGGSKLREWHYTKKLAKFLSACYAECVDNNEFKKHLNKITKNKKQLENEVTHILILIERHLDLMQSEMLGKIHIFCIMNNDKFSWDDFCVYAGIIEKLIVSDINCLREIYKKELITSNDNYPEDSLLRLSSLGLLRIHGTTYTINVKYEYSVTDAGKTLGKACFGKDAALLL